MIILAPAVLHAQSPLPVQVGDAVPREVREMYERGLQYLATSQTEAGDWPGNYRGAGTTGMAVMAFLASGEDPNFGIYSDHVRRALQSMLAAQDANTGYLGDSMYQHGFAMLGLAEAYGVVDDGRPMPGSTSAAPRSIGMTLELAVRLAITAQKKNSAGGWRYTPDASDADTSVSGAVLMGLLAARNAGIEVPDANIDRAIAYFKSMTSEGGQVAYSGGFGGFDESLPRIAIASLVYSVSRRKDLPQYETTLTFLKDHLETEPRQWVDYARYYQSQALFQGDMDAWEKWNRLLVQRLKKSQQEDGSFSSDLGPSVGTSLSLLALALNFRFLPIYER
ncbi:MAG: terpene cyclase/mutase family protein [Planctomycetota bacterium]|nr:terpene cyclase/mutase family protein [Planctomycetota bacterium]